MRITNIYFTIFFMKHHPLHISLNDNVFGSGGNLTLPDHIKNSNYIITRFKNENLRFNICFFRCVSYSLYELKRSQSVEKHAKFLFKRFFPNVMIDDFPGVSLNDIKKYEKKFKFRDQHIYVRQCNP